MKKRILLTAYNLDLGGIETALVNLLNTLNYNKYEVTLLLEQKKGIFLDKIPSNVTIEEYNIHNDSNVILRKIKNRLKLIKWIIKNYHKYDFSGCFTTYCIPGSILARFASKNNAFWIHSNYYYVYNKDISKIKQFFDERKINKYNKIIFVANEARNDLIKIYPEIKDKTQVLNNIMNYQNIINKSSEKINDKKPSGKLLVFVGRLEEASKRITRLLDAMKELKYTNLWIIGDGPDKELYENIVKENKLTNVKLLGKKTNPYPYIKLSDLVVLTSDYEGFPVVCLESMILEKTFLSTIKLSDPYINLDDYGILVKKDTKDITKNIKDFINNKSKKEIKKFSPEEYNKNLLNDLTKLIEGDDDNA